MQAPLKDKQDIKIFILYLMKEINTPLNFVTLADICLQDDFVRQFDFFDCLFDLIENGMVKKTASENGDIYEITEKGKEICEILENELLQSMKTRALENAKRLLVFQKENLSFGSDIIQKDGKFLFRCSIFGEKRVPVMHTEILLDDENMAKVMKYNFDNNPHSVFRTTMSMFSGDFDYMYKHLSKKDK